MARELQVILWCDLCRAMNDKTPATQTFDVTISGTRRVFDVCGDHASDFVSMEAMMPYGMDPDRVDPEPEKDRPEVCPLCEYRGPSRAALGQHVKKHGKTLSTLKEEGLID